MSKSIHNQEYIEQIVNNHLFEIYEYLITHPKTKILAVNNFWDECRGKNIYGEEINMIINTPLFTIIFLNETIIQENGAYRGKWTHIKFYLNDRHTRNSSGVCQ